MFLVIDLIGELNCHVIGCEDSRKVIGAFRSVYCSGRSFVSPIVSSAYCLFILTSLISRWYGAGSSCHRFSGVCSKLVNQLSRVSRW